MSVSAAGVRHRLGVGVAALALGAIGVTVAACSSSGGLTTAQRQLEAATQQVRSTAANGSYSELKSAVAQLKRIVASEEASGDLGAAEASQIENDAQAVLTAASPKPTLPSTSSSPVTIPPTTQAPPPTSASPTQTPTTPSETPTTPSQTPTTSTATTSATSSDTASAQATGSSKPHGW